MGTYNPAAWYWVVAGDVTRAYSGAAAAYVPVTDAGFVAWLAAGNKPTRINSEADLAAVFAAQYPAGWQSVVSSSLSIGQEALTALAAGCAIVSTSAPALNGTYPCTPSATANITSIQTRINAGLGLPLGLSTIAWFDMGGAVHQFTAAQFTDLGKVISDYVYELDLISMGSGATLPSQPVTIP